MKRKRKIFDAFCCDVWRFLRVECMPLSLFARLYAVVLLRLRYNGTLCMAFRCFVFTCCWLFFLFLSRSLACFTSSNYRSDCKSAYAHTNEWTMTQFLFDVFFAKFCLLFWLDLGWLVSAFVNFVVVCCWLIAILLLNLLNSGWLAGSMAGKWFPNYKHFAQQTKKKKFFLFALSVVKYTCIYYYYFSLLICVCVFSSLAVYSHMNGSHFSYTHEKKSAF